MPPAADARSHLTRRRALLTIVPIFLITSGAFFGLGYLLTKEVMDPHRLRVAMGIGWALANTILVVTVFVTFKPSGPSIDATKVQQIDGDSA